MPFDSGQTIRKPTAGNRLSQWRGRFMRILAPFVERRRVQERLRKVEERCRLANLATRDIIYDWDMLTGLVGWNEAARQVLCDPPQGSDCRVEAWIGRLHPEERDGVLADLKSTIERGEEVWSAEYRFRFRDGTYRMVQDRGFIARDPSGRPRRMIGSMRDVHERRQAEADLRRVHDLLTGIIEGSSDLIAALDLDFRFLTLNRAYQAEFKRIFGIEVHEGESLHEILAHLPTEQHCLIDMWTRALQGEEFVTTHEFGEPEHGHRIYEIRFSSIRGHNGHLIGAAHIVRDITQRKRAEGDLKKANAELARSNAELERFASIVSHDLRSPMLSISGYVYLLESDPAIRSSAEATEAVESIRMAVDQMNGLLKGLLDYARVGRGGLKITEENLEAALRNALVNLKAELESARARVTHDALPVLRADHMLLTQLLQNLIGNAIKYRSEAPPAIRVSARQGDGDWVISVSDNGIGISPEHHERIFGMFQRLHADESHYTGMGVGLALCKKIAEQHGGRIWVESRPGQGSAFQLSLPQRR